MKKLFSRSGLFYIGTLVLVGVVTIVVVGLLININQRKQEAAVSPVRIVDIPTGELDPAVWGQNFPNQYDSFNRTKEDYGKTPYGGSTPYSKLEVYPAMVRLWAGYAFAKTIMKNVVTISPKLIRITYSASS